MSEMQSGARRRNKFLVVVDDTPECKVAVRFATARAVRVGGGVTLLHVLEPPDFQHWMGVGEVMREEARQEAELLLQGMASEIQAHSGLIPEFVIREGHKRDEVVGLIEEDPDIRILVLAAAAEATNPGPLIKSLVSERSGAVSIPITVVPGTLTDQEIDELT
ncbi:universal stress protein [Oceanibacterium hippocampi]|uniref:Universal stress protein family protein n=1 Tax=Oceanibacterium hippocampi TaxID=745714 RepID=A0A1Y5RPF9_9PROT|nr:universal stress protein [Oceanibacterium hippocampi]SLN19585.1 Universal stress protein family protein [Oceanibacterium hippocampi]